MFSISLSSCAKAGTVLSAVILAGCVNAHGQYPAVGGVAPGSESIVFSVPEFAGSTPARAQYTELWEREEYALFQGGGAQAEAVYVTATESEVALEYDKTIAFTVERWNFNRNQPKRWQESSRVDAPLRELFYQPYHLVGRNRDCFGFFSSWDDKVEDPDQRPASLLFGYYCAPEGQPLDLDAIETMAQNIGVRGVTERIRRYRAGTQIAQAAVMPTRDETLRIARGSSPAAATGIPDFPLEIARQYQIGGGDGGAGFN